MNVGVRAEMFQSQRADALPTEINCSVRHIDTVDATDLKLQLWPNLIYVLNFAEMSSCCKNF